MLAALVGLGLILAVPQDNVAAGTASIAGEVRDDQGHPRSDVTVTVIRRVDARGTELPRLTPATTNSQGEFRVDGLIPGGYYVLASPPNRRGRETAVMPTYYPGVTNQQSAATVTAAGGQTVTGIFITMQSVPAFEISGTVVDEQGRPMRAMIVFVSQSVQTWNPNQSAGLRASVSGLTTRADGTFRITGLGPGSYRLTPLPAPAERPQQIPPEIIAVAVNGNRSTKQVDVHESDVSDVRIILRSK